MSLPKTGETVKVVLRSGETVEGMVEWVDGNGAWVKGPDRSRWIPVETFLMPPPEPSVKKESGSEE
jgi:hypothetical protein